MTHIDRNKPSRPPTGPIICPEATEGPGAGESISPGRSEIARQIRNDRDPRTGPTVCPEFIDGPGPGDMPGPRVVRPVAGGYIAPTPPDHSAIDVVPEPECEIPEHISEIRKPDTSKYAFVAPDPSPEQRAAQKPANFAENVQKLQILGVSRDRAENALVAADFDLKRAMAIIQGRKY